MNPVGLLKIFLGKGGTPEQLLQGATITNPLIANLIGLAKKGDTKSVEAFARNLFKEMGGNRDFDKEFSDFKNSIK